MKKIMFDDKYGLTDVVLKGRKTMTRRIIRNLLNFDPRQDWIEWGIDEKGKANIAIFHNETYKYSIYPQYQPGEVVAVAQSYESMANSGYLDRMMETSSTFKKEYCGAGWNNKMFVRPDLMPHQIRITNIKAERLQDISDEDCMCEGVTWDYDDYPIMSRKVYFINDYEAFLSPRLAFAALINRICGKSTWEYNPYVFAYSFELVK